MTPDERVSYIREVVWALSGKTPEEYRMTSAEFDVIAGWMDRGIPLRVVLQAVGQFPRPRLERFPRTVMYVKPAVEEEIARWRRAIG